MMGVGAPADPAATASTPAPPASAGTSPDAIVVRGARVHNLKDIDCEYPLPTDGRDGPSGSGKSSLAFDTLYAEGSGAMSSPSPLTPGSSSSGWRNQM